MVVCKFFQQGSCRFGQSCRNEHIYGSKYSYHSNAQPQAAAAAAAPTVTDEQLINQVHSDVQAVLRGGQWLLSSYAPFKEKPPFPGLTDLSPEEARLFIYEAKASNNIDQACAYMNQLFKEAKTKYEQLLLKNTNITRVFRSLYKGENVPSPFDTVSQENSASSVFRSAVQTAPFVSNQTPSIFSQNTAPSIFAQNTPSVFSQNSGDPAKSIFAQANQSTNIFATQYQNNSSEFVPQTDNTAKSFFAQATQNIFAPATPQNDPANLFATASQSIFSQNIPLPSQTSIFQKAEPQNPIAMQQNVFQQVSGDMSYYSKMDDLSPEDIEAFKSNDFKLGYVPEVPPPHSLCF